MNAFIEERVREMPEQYYWLHKRFKTRPKGQEKFYNRQDAKKTKEQILSRQGRQERQEEQKITGKWESGALSPDRPPRRQGNKY